MKKITYLLIFLLLLCFGCEDVIEVETPSEPPRLVVEGLIRVDRSEPYIPVEIKVSLTDNFFGESPVTALESIVIIYEEMQNGVISNTGSSTLWEEVPGTGIYTPDPNFLSDQRISTAILERDITFTLLITHEGRRYFATTKYVPAVPIDNVVQGSGTLFDGDETEAIITFTDIANRNDYYVFEFGFGDYLVTEDEFYQGQQFQFSWFYDQTFASGTQIEISLMGATEEFYNYMDQLIEQAGDLQGPFQTPVATVRGNVFDITGLDNIEIFDNVERPNSFPLGYFAIVQEYRKTLTIR
ncbi:MAG: DUF4249 domain-containing protein [Eudoraea sp.]|nr:DUF4249 domain-containing protein [Eudoraea sp.]